MIKIQFLRSSNSSGTLLTTFCCRNNAFILAKSLNWLRQRIRLTELPVSKWICYRSLI